MTKTNQLSVSRRGFFKFGAIAGLGVTGAGLAACAPSETQSAKVADTGEGSQSAEKESWRVAPEPVDADAIVETLNADVVVVGAGNAGVMAACAAAEEGASVILLEKVDGITTSRKWIGALGTKVSKASGSAPDAGLVLNEFARYADNRVRQSLIKKWTTHSGETIDWIGEILAGEYEIRFQDNVNEGTHYKEYPLQHSVHSLEDGKSVDCLNPIIEHFPQVQLMYQTPMKYLIREEGDSGRVTGVVAESEAGPIEITANKGVILCTGGYCGNQEMLEEINPEAADGIVQMLGMPQNTGDGIRAGVWAGAAKDPWPTAMIFDRGVTLPGETGGTPYSSIGYGPGFVFGSQPFLIVNRKGERFVNESLPYDYKTHAAWQQDGKVWIEIWDANWKGDVNRFNTIGCSRIAPAGNDALGGIFPIPAHEEYMAKMEEAGALVRADSIGELAQKIGIPEATLSETINRYNELAEKGVDEDFGKESFRLSKVATPPFAAITLGGQMLCTLDGLSIDDTGNVLDEDGNPIEGLYAAGNNAGGFFVGNYPELLVGCGVGRALTMGRLAGKTVAAL